MHTNSINRRRYERLALRPMYTAITVRQGDGDALEGHAYDVSEGGVQFELDRAIAPGTAVTMSIELPQYAGVDAGRAIRVSGNVVWADESEPGPVRMALAVTMFAEAGDKARLIAALGRGRMARAA